jgi:DNA-binding response OmpR family regulator
MSKPGVLKGFRVLVAEDEAIIAFELEAFLTEAGAIVIGPSYNLDDAMDHADGDELSAAVLDIRLGEENIAPVARRLTERGIPFLFYSGQVDTDPILAEWPNSVLISKPASPRIVVHALAELLQP